MPPFLATLGRAFGWAAKAAPGAPPQTDPLSAPLRDDGFAVKHVQTFAGVIGGVAKTYRSRFDEALRDSEENARAMLRDAFLRTLLNERMAPTIRAKWHIEPEDETDIRQRRAADTVTRAIKSIRRFQDFRRSLLWAVWYGKAGVQVVAGRAPGCAHATTITDWQPVHGDKILYRWDGTPGVMVQASMASHYRDRGATVLPTDRGLALFLDTPAWRERFVIHAASAEDADYREPELAGKIRGVGLRDIAYWYWNLKNEVQGYLLDHLQRVGAGGLTLIGYDAGNPDSKAAATVIAQDIQTGNVILVPNPKGTENKTTTVERIEAGEAGATTISSLVDNTFNATLERLFVGQSMSGGADNDSGLGGSGRAKFAQATKHDLIASDCDALDETMTETVVASLVRWNCPGADFRLRYVSDQETPDPAAQLDAVTKAYAMGVDFKKDEVRGLTGLGAPGEGDDVVSKEKEQQQQGGGMMGGMMGGLMGGMGGPPGADPNAPPPDGPDGMPVGPGGMPGGMPGDNPTANAPPGMGDYFREQVNSGRLFDPAELPKVKAEIASGEWERYASPDGRLGWKSPRGAIRYSRRLAKGVARRGDWYHALVAAGLDRTGDMGQALDLADRAGDPPVRMRCNTPPVRMQAGPHKFASTQINITGGAGGLVRRLAARILDEDLAEDGREAEPHVTVKYGLHTDDPDAVRNVVEGFGPVTFRIGKTSLFPAKEAESQRGGDVYDVVKLDVGGDDIRRLNTLIADALEHTDTHPKYVPHITLAYVKAGRGPVYAGDDTLDGLECVAHSITFSNHAGDHFDIPLHKGGVVRLAKWATFAGKDGRAGWKSEGGLVRYTPPPTGDDAGTVGGFAKAFAAEATPKPKTTVGQRVAGTVAKAEHAGKAFVQAAIAKLPPKWQQRAKQAYRLSMVTYAAGHAAAKAAAKESGLSDADVERVGRLLALGDVIGMKAGPMAMGAAGAGAAVAAVGSLVPLASSLYLIYATAKNPAGVLAAARAAIAAVRDVGAGDEPQPTDKDIARLAAYHGWGVDDVLRMARERAKWTPYRSEDGRVGWKSAGGRVVYEDPNTGPDEHPHGRKRAEPDSPQAAGAKQPAEGPGDKTRRHVGTQRGERGKSLDHQRRIEAMLARPETVTPQAMSALVDDLMTLTTDELQALRRQYEGKYATKKADVRDSLAGAVGRRVEAGKRIAETFTERGTRKPKPLTEEQKARQSSAARQNILKARLQRRTLSEFSIAEEAIRQQGGRTIYQDVMSGPRPGIDPQSIRNVGLDLAAMREGPLKNLLRPGGKKIDELVREYADFLPGSGRFGESGGGATVDDLVEAIENHTRLEQGSGFDAEMDRRYKAYYDEQVAAVDTEIDDAEQAAVDAGDDESDVEETLRTGEEAGYAAEEGADGAGDFDPSEFDAAPAPRRSWDRIEDADPRDLDHLARGGRSDRPDDETLAAAEADAQRHADRMGEWAKDKPGSAAAEEALARAQGRVQSVRDENMKRDPFAAPQQPAKAKPEAKADEPKEESPRPSSDDFRKSLLAKFGPEAIEGTPEHAAAKERAKAKREAEAVVAKAKVASPAVSKYALGKHPGQIKADEFLKQSDYDKALRANYFDENGNKIASSREKPASVKLPEVGTWKIDDTFAGSRGRDIEQLHELTPEQLKELVHSEDNVQNNFEGRGWDAERYAEWMKDGLQPPPPQLIETDDGKLKIVDGHRRVSAAILAGVPLKAWVSPSVPTGQDDSNGKPIKTGLTHELAQQHYERSGDPTAAERAKLQTRLKELARQAPTEWTLDERDSVRQRLAELDGAGAKGDTTAQAKAEPDAQPETPAQPAAEPEADAYDPAAIYNVGSRVPFRDPAVAARAKEMRDALADGTPALGDALDFYHDGVLHTPEEKAEFARLIQANGGTVPDAEPEADAKQGAGAASGWIDNPVRPMSATSSGGYADGSKPRFGANGEVIEGEVHGLPVTTAKRGLLSEVSPKTRRAIDVAFADPETQQALKDAGIHTVHIDQKDARHLPAGWTMAHANGVLMINPLSAERVEKRDKIRGKDRGIVGVIHHEAGHGLFAKTSDANRSAFRAAIAAHPDVADAIAREQSITPPKGRFDDSRSAEEEYRVGEIHAELNAIRKYDPQRFASLPQAVRDAVSAIAGTPSPADKPAAPSPATPPTHTPASVAGMYDRAGDATVPQADFDAAVNAVGTMTKPQLAELAKGMDYVIDPRDSVAKTRAELARRMTGRRGAAIRRGLIKPSEATQEKWQAQSAAADAQFDALKSHAASYRTLYDSAGSDTPPTDAAIDAALEPLHAMPKADVLSVAQMAGVNARLASKAAAIEALRQRVAQRRDTKARVGLGIEKPATAPAQETPKKLEDSDASPLTTSTGGDGVEKPARATAESPESPGVAAAMFPGAGDPIQLTAATAPGVSIDDIPYDVAYNAHRNTSHTPERRAKQRQDEYVQQMNADWEYLSKFAKTPEQMEELKAEFERYKNGYRDRKLATLAAASRTASPMITGPARFPVDSNRKRLESEDKRRGEMVEFRERALKSIRKKFAPETGAVQSNNPQAVELLQKELAAHQQRHERMKTANKIIQSHTVYIPAKGTSFKAGEYTPAKTDYRPGKTPEGLRAALAGAGVSDDDISKLLKPNYMGAIGHEGYELSNSSANMRRIQKRIDELQSLRASPHKEEEYTGGVKVVEDPDAARIRVTFPGKPDRATIDKLKRGGFRWSPSEGAWQRHLNNGGRYATTALLASLGHTKIESQADGSSGDVPPALQSDMVDDER